ncbi:MAG: DUF4115 domain-containing protein [Syntrophales bacterium]|nr:DUF4115 domain-containing protein [Syntrophales bacterium]
MMIKNINIPPQEEANGDSKRTCSDLKAIRESKGITLGDLFQITRISTDNLEAIENGDFHLLPPPIYAKAFIKNYTKGIGTDSQKILDYYEKYLEALNPSYEKEDAEKSHRTASHNKKLLLIFSALSLILVAGVVIFWISQYNEIAGGSPPHKSGKTILIPDIPEAKPAEESNPQIASGRGDAAQAKPEESYPLSIEARELTWLRIREGQNPPYEVLLKPGDKIERSAAFFVIDIGNAGGLNAEFQGVPLSNLGRSGQVVHLRLPQN